MKWDSGILELEAFLGTQTHETRHVTTTANAIECIRRTPSTWKNVIKSPEAQRGAHEGWIGAKGKTPTPSRPDLRMER